MVEGLNVVVPRIPLVPSAVLTMNNFQQHKQDSGQWYSPPVYTHHQGYRVDANGHGTGRGTHVSVYLYFMKGEFDDSLKWPFRGVIVFRVLDQVKGEDHETYPISYNDEMENKYCRRVSYGERATDGWGNPEFIVFSRLSPKYVRNDTLQLEVYDGVIYA